MRKNIDLPDEVVKAITIQVIKEGCEYITLDGEEIKGNND